MKKIILIMMMACIGKVSLSQQLIADFEAWHNYSVGLVPVSLSAPDGWQGLDSVICYYGKLFNPLGSYVKQVFKETPGNGSSSSALKVVSKQQDSLVIFSPRVYPGMATNSQVQIDLVNSTMDFIGGTALNFVPATTSMYVKNNPVGGDSTFILVELIDNSDGGDSIVAVADTAFSATISSYTKINLNFVPTGSTLTPNIVRYYISSGNVLSALDTSGTFSLHANTELIVDDIEISNPLGISQYLVSSKQAKVYPTLLNDDIHVNFTEGVQLKYAALAILDMQGKMVKRIALDGKLNTISCNNWIPGQYVYVIYNDGKAIQTGKLAK